jgi:Bacterial regulatory protein, arsR family
MPDSGTLAEGEQAAGAVSAVVQEEFGISQPTVSQHLGVLRDNGFTTVWAEGARRLYAVAQHPCRRSTCGWSATGSSESSAWTPSAPSSREASENAARRATGVRLRIARYTGRTGDSYYVN